MKTEKGEKRGSPRGGTQRGVCGKEVHRSFRGYLHGAQKAKKEEIVQEKKQKRPRFQKTYDCRFYCRQQEERKGGRKIKRGGMLSLTTENHPLWSPPRRCSRLGELSRTPFLSYDAGGIYGGIDPESPKTKPRRGAINNELRAKEQVSPLGHMVYVKGEKSTSVTRFWGTRGGKKNNPKPGGGKGITTPKKDEVTVPGPYLPKETPPDISKREEGMSRENEDVCCAIETGQT